ncbi:MAG: hypothetical protein KGN76_17990 [Acidobacteriota bacterium]|nr:hypothetical protein [Acidobacteriota bacterium]
MLLAGPEVEPMVKLYGTAFVDRLYAIGGSGASLIGAAIGMAMNDHRVFVYLPTPQEMMAAVELLREEVGPARLPVVVAAAGATCAPGPVAGTTPAIDDVAVMCAVPGMTVVAPGDLAETQDAVKALAAQGTPAYLRLVDSAEAIETGNPATFALGRARRLREGADATIFGCGAILADALAAAETLSEAGVQVRVVEMATIQPIDAEEIRRACVETRALLTVEEHGVAGGLGAAVAEVLATMPAHPPLKVLGFRKGRPPMTGTREHLLADEGLDAAGIARETGALLEASRAR